MSTPVDRQPLFHLMSDVLSVDVATRGARITSLKSLGDGREWLTRERGDARAAPSYGARFTDTDHCGWDEIFPSVNPCAYPVAPYMDWDVPDHGELWSATWDVLDATPTSILQRTRSEHFGYNFERSLVIEGATLRAEYACTIDSETPGTLPMLWALHPQFSVQDGSRVQLSGEPSHILDTSDPAAVHRVDWRGDLVVARDVQLGKDRMIYVVPDEPVDEARIVDPSGASLCLRWDHSFAPYLGIWMDNGRFTNERVVALEPTNGFFDELARASCSGRVGLFAPGRRVSWWVQVRVEQGDR